MMRRLAGKHSLALVCLVLSAVACLAAPPNDTSGRDPCAVLCRPSKFDYLVLASIADSPHLLALASYRSSEKPRDAAKSSDKADDSVPTPYRTN